jgi:hypothetical protein
MVVVWLPELPPIPATIGIRAANATSFSMDPSNAPITRDAMNAVMRLTNNHAHRFLKLSRTGAKISSSSLNPASARTCSALDSRM